MRLDVGGLIVVLGLAYPASLHAADPPVTRLLPVNEASQEPTFKVFHDQFLVTIQKRDKTALMSILAARIKNDFGGGDDGAKGFASQWQIDQPDSRVWRVLLEALMLGGAFTGPKTFCAPYVYAKFPSALDAFGHEVIIRKSAALRAQASATASIIETLSYDIVEVDYDHSVRDPSKKEIYIWLKVTAPSGKIGFVARADLRSPIDYRACFEKIDGAWKMVMLVAGD